MSIDEHYSLAYKMACDKVEKMARSILKRHPNLTEFVMAMGSYSFSTKDGKGLSPYTEQMTPSYQYRYQDTFKYLKPLNNFISKWDSYLKITGTPMRFTATGKKITDW